MSRLTLAKKLHQILRVDANLPGTAPTATTSQTGILAEIVGFLDDGYLEIQQLHEDWGFRLLQGTFNISSGTRAYTRATIQATLTTFDQFVLPRGSGSRSLPVYLTATGVSDSSHCYYVPYKEWRGYLDFGTRSSGKPSFFTIRQDQTIEFDPTPDATYTVAIDYRRTLHVFSADADETLWADDYDDALVWKAVMLYCDTRDGTGELMAKANRNYNAAIGRMRGRYRPGLTWDSSLLHGSLP
jgi:hypothetical protein